jgi:hypothetical protein
MHFLDSLCIYVFMNEFCVQLAARENFNCRMCLYLAALPSDQSNPQHISIYYHFFAST